MKDNKELPIPEFNTIKMEVCRIRNIAATGYYGIPTGTAYSEETGEKIGTYVIVGLNSRDEAMYPKEDMEGLVQYNSQGSTLKSHAFGVGIIFPIGLLPKETREDIIIQVSTSRSMAEMLTKNTSAWAYVLETGNVAIKYNDDSIALGGAENYVLLTKDVTRLGGNIIFDDPDKTLLLRTNLLAAAFPLTEAVAQGYPASKSLDLVGGPLMKSFEKISIFAEGFV